MQGITLLRNGAIASFILTVGLLIFSGYFANQQVPPIPGKVVVEGQAQPVMTRDDIMRGQHVYQSHGLMDHGSVWGHGTLRGMDFSADTLHRIGEAMREHYDQERTHATDPFIVWTDSSSGSIKAHWPALPEKDRTQLIDSTVISEMRTNRYDAATDVLTLTPAQAYALEQIRAYWDKEFREGDPRVGFLPDTIADASDRKAIADFFFWTAWSAGTNRPGETYSYTNNWPADTSVGNTPPPGALLWSIGGILSLFGVLGIVIYIVHRYRFFHGHAGGVEAGLAMLHQPLTPSQRSSAKFFLVAGLLFMVQILHGGLLANYTVKPAQFFIEGIGQKYAYSWAKTWHLQLAIFWIAISWMGTAIFVAPMIAGKEPRRQRLLVNLLFVAAVVVLLGSLLGEVLSLKGLLGDWWFWLGHQGWEYLELGRLWQVLLFVGLLFWVAIVYRAMVPAMRNKDESPEKRSLILFYTISAIMVVVFFGFGLFYGPNTHLTVADYWRWFVVHIWVESIFEFFGIAVIALFLVTLGLVSAASALRVAYLTAILVFLGGMLGTAHHYFWTGGPGMWLAIGSVFSSLEVIPLILLVVRAWMEYKSITDAGGEFPYKWPLFFLVASSVWNFVGAAIFGFVINLPIVNYYEHATYLTANHAHTALFGVYGMLAIALILFSWRGLVENKHWNDRILKVSFWGLNGGLFLMFATALLPIGLSQVWHSYADGLWWARSADFYELPHIQMLAKWRIVPDLILIVIGACPLLWFLLTTFPRLRK